MDGISKAIAKRGLTGLAREMGVSKGVIYQWRERGIVPPQYCPAIEKLMNGEVTRKDLRPDDWERIWPELAEPKSNRRSTDPKDGA